MMYNSVSTVLTKAVAMPTMKVKVTRNGNSAVVTIPTQIRNDAGINIGDVLEISFSGAGPLVLSKPDTGENARKKALDRLLASVDSTPSVPWADDSPEADRDLLAGRYV